MKAEYIKVYIKSIKSILPFYTKNEKDFLKNLNSQLKKAYENHEISDYDSLLDLYGTPSKVVSSYIYGLDFDDVQKSFNIKRRNSNVLLFVIASIILIASIRIYLLNEEYHDVSEGIIVYEESFIVEN